MRAIRRRVALFALAALVPFAAVAQPSTKGKTGAPLQPGLLALAQPRIAELRDAGITQIVGRAASRNNVQMLTRYGPAYFRWPRWRDCETGPGGDARSLSRAAATI